MAGDAAELEKRDLGKNMDKLRLFNARRKFKSAISSVSGMEPLVCPLRWWAPLEARESQICLNWLVTPLYNFLWGKESDLRRVIWLAHVPP